MNKPPTWYYDVSQNLRDIGTYKSSVSIIVDRAKALIPATEPLMEMLHQVVDYSDDGWMAKLRKRFGRFILKIKL